MTTTGTIATVAEKTAAGLALAEALDAVARLFDDAMATIAEFAEAGDAPEVQVVRLAERPTVGQRTEAAAA